MEGEITESTTKVYSKWTSSGKPELYKEYYQKNNKYGAELHYKQWNYTAGFRKCIEEDIRDIDANNNYLAGYFMDLQTMRKIVDMLELLICLIFLMVGMALQIFIRQLHCIR